MKKTFEANSRNQENQNSEGKKMTRMKWELAEEEAIDTIIVPPLSGVFSIRNDCQIGQWKVEETQAGNHLPMILVDVTFGRGLIPPIHSAEKFYEQIVKSKEKPYGFSPNWFTRNEFGEVTGIADAQEILNTIFEKQVKDWAFVWFIPVGKEMPTNIPKLTLCGTFVKSTSLSRRGTGLIEYLENLKINRKIPIQTITLPQFRPTHSNKMDGKDCLGLVWESADLDSVKGEEKEEYEKTLKLVNEWINSPDFQGEFLLPDIAKQWVECGYEAILNGDIVTETKLALKICKDLKIENAEEEVKEFLGLSLPWDKVKIPLVIDIPEDEMKELPGEKEVKKLPQAKKEKE